MDKERVREALKVIDEALDSDEFNEWLEKNIDELEYLYEGYANGCVEDMEAPEDFYLWALRKYVDKDDA